MTILFEKKAHKSEKALKIAKHATIRTANAASGGPGRHFLIAMALATMSVMAGFSGIDVQAEESKPPTVSKNIDSELAKRLEWFERQARGRHNRAVAKAIRSFYATRDNDFQWFQNGTLKLQAQTFFAALRRLEDHGLRPEDYGMPDLAKRAAKATTESERARIEIALSASLVRYAGDLAAGSITPSRTRPGLYITPERPDADRVLSEMSEVNDFKAYLASLEPKAVRYNRLKNALARYRQLAKNGGWKKIAPGPTLKPGMTDNRVAQVRARLMVTGDLTVSSEKPKLFDEVLKKAVTAFQMRHGLEEDGAVGRMTLATMNVPVERRIQQIIINMERRRWMPKSLGKKYVFANIADFDLKVVENDKTIYVARIVVGRTYHKTPIFSDKIKYIEFNPHWNVPYSIASKELLPKIKKDPLYLTRNRYMLLTRPVDNSSEISPTSVDWSAVRDGTFPYYIRQKPGRGNALGTMIFMFPNRYNVFIHDTQSRSLFSRSVRSFSHGCVRIQYPHKLALLLLRDKSGWSEKRVKDIVASEKPQRAYLKNPVPVHITYLTAWANKDKSVQFRPDIYRRDTTLIKLLDRPSRKKRN